MSTSLAEAITARFPPPPLPTPPALANLVAAPAADAWVPEAEPPPRLAPTPEASAAIAILTALPNDGEWFHAAAGRELRNEGHPDPSASAIAIRAAEILHRTDPESRSA